MKIPFHKVAVAAAVIGLNLIAPPAGSAFAAEQKIGTVNMQKIFDDYYKTVRSTEDLKHKAGEMDKERTQQGDAIQKEEEEWQKLFDKSEDQALSTEERTKNKKAAADKLVEIKEAKQALQQYNMACSSKLRELEHERRDNIINDIRRVLDAQAKAAGYSFVLDVSGQSANGVPTILYSNGNNDLTESLIKELNAAQLPTSAPDNDKDKKDAKTPAERHP
jgi:Skp family chaperone for outer membrane proteins